MTLMAKYFDRDDFHGIEEFEELDKSALMRNGKGCNPYFTLVG